MDALTITRPQLEAAFLQWEHAHRAGQCMDAEAAAKLSAADVAARNAASMWYSLATSAADAPTTQQAAPAP